MNSQPTSLPANTSDVNAFLHYFRFSRFLAVLLTLAVIAAGAATYIAYVDGQNPFGYGAPKIIALIAANLAFLLVLMFVIFRRVRALRAAVRQGSVGSRLQTRLVSIFTLVAILPTIIVALFSTLFFNFGIKSWFDDRVRIALEESVKVSEAYLSEHKDSIRNDAMAMTADLQHNLGVIISNPNVFNAMLTQQAGLRNLSEAIVFSADGVVARTALSFSLEFERLPPQFLERADSGDVVVMGDDNDDKIRALVKLDDITGLYLLVGRVVDQEVIEHMIAAKSAVGEYQQLQHNITSIQLQFSLVFVLVSLLLLLAAVWYGMYIALKLSVPITNLIVAAERVRAGDYSIKVPEGMKEDEIADLSRTFNRMTQQLENQRRELMEANQLLDERRRFTETVFLGVSAGVFALNRRGEITIFNRSAQQLLGITEDATIIGNRAVDVLPEIADMLEQAERKPEKLISQDVKVKRGEAQKTFHVRIAAERYSDTTEGFIVTFDDISELVSAQRTAAWSDVARRIAHEIKNPLTPITLSTERLKKKYLDEISSDKESFVKYTDTIAKHVKDIGRMVEEFVAFARLPAPIFRKEDMAQIIRKIVFSEKTAHPEIRYVCEIEPSPLYLVCDERQVSQILTNLLKNAAESIEARQQSESAEAGSQSQKGEIQIRSFLRDDMAMIEVLDNGTGFPPDKIATLTEPYVTTRAKGTGLGLAIVKKSMEDHKGSILLENRQEGGAKVVLAFSTKIDVDIQNS